MANNEYIYESSYEFFLKRAEEIYGDGSYGYRKGQVYFNVADTFQPILIDHLMNSPSLRDKYDPYYNDDKLPAFLEYLKENWI